MYVFFCFRNKAYQLVTIFMMFFVSFYVFDFDRYMILEVPHVLLFFNFFNFYGDAYAPKGREHRLHKNVVENLVGDLLLQSIIFIFTIFLWYL